MNKAGRYRRAFEWKLQRDDQEDTDTAIRALGALFSSEMPAVLEDYLEISRKRSKNRLALARLQAHLLDELLTVEATVKFYRDEKAKLEPASNFLEDEGRPTTTNRDLTFVKKELFFWRAFANVIRSIADGMAWRTLNFDRAVLRALCQNRGSQHVTSPGTAEELREWSRHFDHGSGIPILNSLTNWLTYGDVTVVGNDGSVEVVEVKASKTSSSRVVRQKQRMRELVTFLSSGKGTLEGKTVEISTLDIVPETGLDILDGLIQQTDTAPGYAAARLSNSTYVECIDLRRVDEPAIDDIVTLRSSLTSDWERNDDDIHTSASLKCLGFSPNMAPFSVFPFAPRLCIDLLTGAKAYMVLLNVSAVAREFRHRNWEVLTTPKQAFEAGTMEEDFMTVRKEGFKVTLPPAAFMRLGMELLRPQVLIRQCELIRQAGPRAFETEFNLAVYEHEAQIWR
jgi:hypothetical protein